MFTRQSNRHFQTWLMPFALTILFILTCLAPAAGRLGPDADGGQKSLVPVGRSGRFAVVTYVLNPDQEKKAEVLINSLRRFGGDYGLVPVYVVLGNPQTLPCTRLQQDGVQLVPTDADEIGRRYPLAIKAYAAAQIERLVADRVDTLAWFDPETMVAGPLKALDLGQRYDVAVKPVFKLNNVGLAADAQPDAFWKPIYQATGLDQAKVPIVKTILEGKPIKAYFNCEIFSVRPQLGIFREWAARLEPFLKDQDYQRTACPDFLHRLFLHQAVLSAVLVSKTQASRRSELPNSCGYPLNLHQDLPQGRKASVLNRLSGIILETLWDDQPGWLKLLEIREPLMSWLRQAFTDYKMIVPGIFREERAQGCNSYLFTTEQGSVLVDAGGTDDPDSWLLEMARERPVQAILLTHAHKDHLAGLERWIAGRNIPVIAQRQHGDFLKYQDLLAGFYARRNAIVAGGPAPSLPESRPASAVLATTFFIDRDTFRSGGVTFEMIHTAGETPDTAAVWIPERRAFCTGDNFFSSFPNISTLRGSPPRWALDYIKAIELGLSLEPEVLLPGHGEPIVGKELVRRKLTEYRDAIRYVHDQTVKGLNEGLDVHTLMREIRLPENLQKLPQAFGRVSWTVRGIYEWYVGWFDGEVANMYDQPLSSIYADLVELAGGADPLAKRAMEMTQRGESVKALHLTDVVLKNDPRHRGALEARLQALRTLLEKTRNYMETQWLAAALRQTQEALKNNP